LAAALLSFLLSPQSQPHGFLISNRPIATSFADPACFEAADAGLLGGQFILRATTNGGIGSETIGNSEGGWCAYANDQAGAVETIPEKGSIPENSVLPEITSQLRSFLGSHAGKLEQFEDKSTAAPVGGKVNIANVMQPIKIGTGFTGKAIGKGKKEDGAGPSRKNLFEDDEEVDAVGKDTVLLSRSTSSLIPQRLPADQIAKGAHIVPPTSGSRKVKFDCIRLSTKMERLLTLWLLDRQEYIQMEYETIGTCRSRTVSRQWSTERYFCRQRFGS